MCCFDVFCSLFGSFDAGVLLLLNYGFERAMGWF